MALGACVSVDVRSGAEPSARESFAVLGGLAIGDGAVGSGAPPGLLLVVLRANLTHDARGAL